MEAMGGRRLEPGSSWLISGPSRLNPLQVMKKRRTDSFSESLGNLKWNPNFGTAGNKEAEAARHRLGLAKEPPDVRGPSPSSLPVSVRQTGSSFEPFISAPDGNGPSNPSPPLPVGPSAGAGSGPYRPVQGRCNVGCADPPITGWSDPRVVGPDAVAIMHPDVSRFPVVYPYARGSFSAVTKLLCSQDAHVAKLHEFEAAKFAPTTLASQQARSRLWNRTAKALNLDTDKFIKHDQTSLERWSSAAQS